MSKIVSGGDQCTSDDASEIIRLGYVDCTYRPADQGEIEQLYAPVEPSNLISNGQTTSVYLTKVLAGDGTDESQTVVLKTIDKEKISSSDLAAVFA